MQFGEKQISCGTGNILGKGCCDSRWWEILISRILSALVPRRHAEQRLRCSPRICRFAQTENCRLWRQNSPSSFTGREGFPSSWNNFFPLKQMLEHSQLRLGVRPVLGPAMEKLTSDLFTKTVPSQISPINLILCENRETDESHWPSKYRLHRHRRSTLGRDEEGARREGSEWGIV